MHTLFVSEEKSSHSHQIFQDQNETQINLVPYKKQIPCKGDGVKKKSNGLLNKWTDFYNCSIHKINYVVVG